MTLPHVDLSTGKIYGCEPYSWKWYHEEGHIIFNNNEWSSELSLIQQYIFWCWMIAVSFTLWILSGILVVAYLGIMIFEELWCNRYANKMVKKRKEQQRVYTYPDDQPFV